MKTLAIVGKPYQAFIDFLAKKHPEIRVIAFQDQNEHNSYPKSIAKVYSLDFKDRDTLTEQLTTYNLKVDGVSCNYEAAILTSVWIGQHFGCSVPSLAATKAATDKFEMRTLFKLHYPEISPDFASVQSEEDVDAFAKAHSFPLVLKPANLMKSLLVTISHNPKELRQNFDDLINSAARIYKKFNIRNYKPTFIIEEFLDGSQHSIDLAIDSNGTITPTKVVDYVIATEIGIDDNYVYVRNLPSTLSAEKQNLLTTCAIKGVTALGLTNTFAHVEIMLTKNGPKIIEIGARPGGYRPRMYQIAFGLDIHQAILDLAFGNPIIMSPTSNKHVAVYELFPKEEAIFDSISNLEQLHQLPSFESISIQKKAGDLVGLSSQGYKFCAVIFLQSFDQQQLIKDQEYLEKNVNVVVK